MAVLPEDFLPLAGCLLRLLAACENLRVALTAVQKLFPQVSGPTLEQHCIVVLALMWPELIMKSGAPAVMAGIITIYNLVVEVLIITNSLNDYISLYGNLLQLRAGRSGAAASCAISIVGDTVLPRARAICGPDPDPHLHCMVSLPPFSPQSSLL
ncbi:hypothetical protein P7K49_016089 [Saguinus oedipus]|uniref:Uncharacterized protein n=1 Tax=Saguinus oedipus TaxID=9490 RepID=A0ABQ9VBW8_SAGOE|nr:hypothetical protein P7K49_016089 [Saguinus oedipus]